MAPAWHLYLVFDFMAITNGAMEMGM